MAAKAIGISHEFIIHPGETIADVLAERGITQADLAKRTGFTEAYISSILAGKKSISANFAMALEYALGVPKSFWLNLQANYDAEILAAEEMSTITEEELSICTVLREVVKYLRQTGMIPVAQKKEETVLSLRKALQVSSLTNLSKVTPTGAFRLAEKAPVNEYVLGAWLQLYVANCKPRALDTTFSGGSVATLIAELKEIMNNADLHPKIELPRVLSKYGIDIRIVQNFKGAPVHGFISRRKDGTYLLVLTIRGAFADIFWFSLFHEIGHIVNGDVNKTGYYFEPHEDDDTDREASANQFASAALLDPKAYQEFVQNADFSYTMISRFASSQRVPAYIVIGRLQKEKIIPYKWYSKKYKPTYKWDSK